MIAFSSFLIFALLCCIRQFESFKPKFTLKAGNGAVKLRLPRIHSGIQSDRDEVETKNNESSCQPEISKESYSQPWRITAATIAAATLCFPQLSYNANAAATLTAPNSKITLQTTPMQIDPFAPQNPTQKPQKITPEVQESVIPLDVTSILRERFTVLRADVTGEKIGQLRVGDSLVNRLRNVDTELDNIQVKKIQ